MTAVLNADKLGKLLALASSDNDNEALSALRMAKTLLTGAGMDFKDVAERMATPKASIIDFDYSAWTRASQPSPPPKPKGYTKGGFTWESKAAYDAHMAQEKARFERDRAKYADERAAILTRYGSVTKAVARDEREQALHDAVAAWLEPQPECKPKGRWSRSLDGWNRYQTLDKATARALDAIRTALPLPTTIPAAIAELKGWEARDNEIMLAVEDYGFNGGLDLPAEMRRDILRRLILTELPATSVAEVIARLEYVSETGGYSVAQEIEPTLADLRRLLAEGNLSNPSTPPSMTDPSTVDTSTIADRIRAMLSADPSTSDRTIARTIGCSPTTAGKVRREAGLSGVARSVQRRGQMYRMKGTTP